MHCLLIMDIYGGGGSIFIGFGFQQIYAFSILDRDQMIHILMYV
jgi:hypothetical protein